MPLFEVLEFSCEDVDEHGEDGNSVGFEAELLDDVCDGYPEASFGDQVLHRVCGCFTTGEYLKDWLISICICN